MRLYNGIAILFSFNTSNLVPFVLYCNVLCCHQAFYRPNANYLASNIENVFFCSFTTKNK